MNDVRKIQGELKKLSSESVRASFQKFVPHSQDVYGVKVPRITELAKRYKRGGFALVDALWQSGAFEERILAAKILHFLAKQDPGKTLQLIKRFSNDITDWAVCDTLGQQSTRPIAGLKQREICQLSKEWATSSNLWKRRLSLVLVESYSKDIRLHPFVRSLVEQLKNDKEHYVKKAVEWTRRNLEKCECPRS
jgi:3-methyladenine DNA glycosylase AlkD